MCYGDTMKNLEDVLNKYNLTEPELEKILKQSKKPKLEKNNSHDHYHSTHRDKFIVTGDWHVGHRNFRVDCFDGIQKVLKKHKIDKIYHCGDLIEGMSNREGHVYELNHLGVSNQINETQKLFNSLNAQIYFINGNHDLWVKNKANQGFNVGQSINDNCSNAHYLGDMKAEINLSPTVKMWLTHEGNSAYALCFDDKTEILTEDGWRLFKDLKNERVATLNLKTDTFEWQKPIDYTEEEYNGEMLKFSARNIDMIVTPNHRMLVRRYNKSIDLSRVKHYIMPQKAHPTLSKEWIIKQAKDLKGLFRQQWQMKRGDQNWKGNIIENVKVPFVQPHKFSNKNFKHIGTLYIDDVAEFLAWYVTEGCASHSTVSICQSQKANPDNYSQILNLLKRMNLKCCVTGKDKKDISINSVELASWVISECGKGSKNVFLPKWLKDQPTDILEIVFDTMIKGDGWVNGKGFGYKSISKRLRDDISEIGIKLGYAVTEGVDSLSFTSEQILPTINKRPESINYKGKIYCVSVPNKIIMVRRNGKAIWSGNSYSGQKRINSIHGGQKPSIWFNGHLHKALYMEYRNIHFFESGTLQQQTDFMAMKGSPAHVGFWMLDVYHNKKGINQVRSSWFPYY